MEFILYRVVQQSKQEVEAYVILFELCSVVFLHYPVHTDVSSGALPFCEKRKIFKCVYEGIN